MSKKKFILKRRDLGHNNAVKRPHLDIWQIKTPFYIEDYRVIEYLQQIVDKIEHKFERCEEFLANNQDLMTCSYYSEGYYNGRARAFEDVIDLIKDITEKEYNNSINN